MPRNPSMNPDMTSNPLRSESAATDLSHPIDASITAGAKVQSMTPEQLQDYIKVFDIFPDLVKGSQQYKLAVSLFTLWIKGISHTLPHQVFLAIPMLCGKLILKSEKHRLIHKARLNETSAGIVMEDMIIIYEVFEKKEEMEEEAEIKTKVEEAEMEDVKVNEGDEGKRVKAKVKGEVIAELIIHRQYKDERFGKLETIAWRLKEDWNSWQEIYDEKHYPLTDINGKRRNGEIVRLKLNEQRSIRSEHVVDLLFEAVKYPLGDKYSFERSQLEERLIWMDNQLKVRGKEAIGLAVKQYKRKKNLPSAVIDVFVKEGKGGSKAEGIVVVDARGDGNVPCIGVIWGDERVVAYTRRNGRPPPNTSSLDRRPQTEEKCGGLKPYAKD